MDRLNAGLLCKSDNAFDVQICGDGSFAVADLIGFIGFETAAWEKSFGRPMKVDRQTIVAVVAALQEWFETDHEARIAGYERRLKTIASEIDANC